MNTVTFDIVNLLSALISPSDFANLSVSKELTVLVDKVFSFDSYWKEYLNTRLEVKMPAYTALDNGGWKRLSTITYYDKNFEHSVYYPDALKFLTSFYFKGTDRHLLVETLFNRGFVEGYDKKYKKDDLKSLDILSNFYVLHDVTSKCSLLRDSIIRGKKFIFDHLITDEIVENKNELLELLKCSLEHDNEQMVDIVMSYLPEDFSIDYDLLRLAVRSDNLFAVRVILADRRSSLADRRSSIEDTRGVLFYSLNNTNNGKMILKALLDDKRYIPRLRDLIDKHRKMHTGLLGVLLKYIGVVVNKVLNLNFVYDEDSCSCIDAEELYIYLLDKYDRVKLNIDHLLNRDENKNITCDILNAIIKSPKINADIDYAGLLSYTVRSSGWDKTLSLLNQGKVTDIRIIANDVLRINKVKQCYDQSLLTLISRILLECPDLVESYKDLVRTSIEMKNNGLFKELRSIITSDTNELLRLSCEHENVYAIKKIIKFHDGDTPNLVAALGVAVREKKHKLVKSILNNPKTVIKQKDNSILKSAVFKDNYRCVKILLKSKKINPSFDGNSCIIIASKHGYMEIVMLLLKHKRVDRTARNNKALHSAIEFKHYEIARALISNYL